MLKVICNYGRCRKDLSDEVERLSLVVQNPSAVDPVIPANDPDAGQLDFCNADHASKFFADTHKKLPAARKRAGKQTLKDTEHGVQSANEFVQAQRADPASLDARARARQEEADALPLGARSPSEDEHFKVGMHRDS